jgi:subtilisin family serine protease
MKMIILRSNRRNLAGDFELAPGHVPAGAEAAEQIQFSVKVEDISAGDAADLHRDPSVDAHAPPMPTILIEPRDIDPAPAAAPETMWGIAAVGADKSHRTGAGIKVAVLDTGIDKSHLAFQGVELIRKNFTSDSDDDRQGHGTHCAGTIFGRDVDGRRIGVARGVTTALIGKVLGQGGGSTDQLVEAVQWAWAEGAHVISMSLGIDFAGYQKKLTDKGMPPQLATSMALAGYRANLRIFDDLSRLIVDNEGMRNSVLVAAAGNESAREMSPDFRITVMPPAAGASFVSVAALGQPAAGDPASKYTVARFSNIGVRLSGPGVDIWSAKLGGGLTAKSGTSMATPHVAGIAALWAEHLKETGQKITGRRLVQVIEKAAVDLPHLLFDDAGFGIIQAPRPAGIAVG